MRRIKPLLPLLAVLFGLLATFAVRAAQTESIDRIVAVVNDDVITQSQLNRELDTIRKRIEASNTEAPPESVLQHQVLEKMILTRLELQEAENTGIRVDDESLNNTLRRIADQNKLSLGEFRQTLESQGYSFAQFREDIRHQIAIARLEQRQVDSHVTVSKQEIANFLANMANRGADTTEYHIGHILIALPDGATPDQIQAGKAKAEKILKELQGGADFARTAISVSDGQQALEGGNLGWRKLGQIPTMFASLVAKMKPGDLSGLVRSPSGFHIVKLLGKRDSARHVVTQTHVRHILIRTNELVSANDAVTRLKQLRARVLAGESFAELARANSDDKGSAIKGGDLGWVNPGSLVPQFEQVMNKTKVNQVSEPFQTPFGWHILQVLGRREYDSTQEYKQAQAAQAIRKRKIEEERDIWLRRLRDEAYVKIMLDDE